MPSLGKLLAGAANNGWLNQANNRAYLTEARITQNPTDITVRRGNATLTAQTVRIEAANTNPMPQNDANNRDNKVRVVVVGYKDHPEVDDTDLLMGDRFVYGGLTYEVIQVLPNIVGGLQAIAEASRS